ncbi:cell shape determination protein CcmA [Paenibacillus rhizovicinus]|uniref:Cell shape determination protein CcmA n=1 Tax=Paenibacillus rhizovicinus TaxID=2704463 RepID=A0A6C0P4C2_9BACL|nr:cell shape determination protein CcmA [Paenibacillus rhizovicinus]QHW33106.1 cell shape determination protein CcmA [Paenibacillus rhizovicinus]
MQATMKRNMKITGTGSTNGGSFHNVRVMGEAQILGPLESESFRSMGTLDVSGTLRAGNYRQVGEVVINGDLVGNQISILGQLDISGSIRGRAVKLRGQLDVHGGECEATSFEARGGFNIHGLLNAGEVDIRTWGPCRVKEIAGNRIVVRQSKWGGLKQLFSGQGAMTLTAELIEGDYVYLENTTADVVRGANVTIGPGCKIGLVEYRKQLRRIGASQVNEEVKR